MGGQILEYEAKTILNKGIALGEQCGEKRGIALGGQRGELKKSVDNVYNLIRKRGFAKEEAMEILDVTEKDWEKVSNLVDEKLSKESVPVS